MVLQWVEQKEKEKRMQGRNKDWLLPISSPRSRHSRWCHDRDGVVCSWQACMGARPAVVLVAARAIALTCAHDIGFERSTWILGPQIVTLILVSRHG